MTAAGSRWGWRLRALVRRHLAVHGGWYAAARARTAPAPDVAPLLAAFLAGQPAPGTDPALVDRLGAELDEEWQRREVAGDSPLGRLTALAVRAGLGCTGGDLLTVVVGRAVDRTYDWFVRTLADSPATPRWLVDDLVDPTGAEPAALGAAWSRAVALGLIALDGAHAVATPAALSWLVAGEVPPLPPGVREHDRALCARRDGWRARVLPASEPVIDERRIIVTGGRDDGAGWIAAATARVRDRGVLATDAAGALAAGPALAAAALVRDASLLVEAPSWSPALAALLAALPTPVVVALPPDPRAAADAARDLGAATVELPPASRAERAAWWTQIVEPPAPAAATHLAAYPLPREVVFDLGAAVRPPTLAALDRAACSAAGPLDRRCRRLAPSPGAEAALPADLAPSVAALRRQLGGAPGAIRLASDTPELAATALCTAAGLELFELSGAWLRTAPEGALACAADLLSRAADRGAAVLLTGIEALPADDIAALTAILATPTATVIVPVSAAGSGATPGPAAPRRLQL
jgi:hypothetical protein